MARKATRQWDVKVLCSIWQDEQWRTLGADAQLAVFRSVAQLGIDRVVSGGQYRAADLGMDDFTFSMVAPDLVRLGVWTFVGDDVVEVWPYGDLVTVVPIRWRARIHRDTRASVLRRDGYACRHCGSTERLEMDHVRPWSLGGSDHPDNLQTLCRPCNYRKGARV